MKDGEPDEGVGNGWFRRRNELNEETGTVVDARWGLRGGDLVMGWDEGLRGILLLGWNPPSSSDEGREYLLSPLRADLFLEFIRYGSVNVERYQFDGKMLTVWSQRLRQNERVPSES